MYFGKKLRHRESFSHLYTSKAKPNIVVSDDQNEAMVGRYQVLGKPNALYERLVLKGLDEDQEYEIEGISGSYFGDELINAGIQLDQAVSGSLQWGDFTSQIFKLKSCR